MLGAWKSPEDMLKDPHITAQAKDMIRDAVAKGQSRLVERLLLPYVLLPTPGEIAELTTEIAESVAVGMK